MEESALQQKARSRWIKLGDSNTKYFSALIQERKHKKQVNELTALDGKKLTEPEEIKTEILQFYKSLMGSTATCFPAVDMEVMKCGPSLNHDQELFLCAEVTDAEIQEGLAAIGDDKAPGIDGYNAVFLKKAWPVIKGEVLKAVKQFFTTGKMTKAINCTSITLIPKTVCPQTVKEFRPISYCTVLYKLISKVLAARIQKVIASIINEAQAGFVPGRKIGDNVILAHELVKSYTRKHISPRCMIKVDMQKAYDSVEWVYLEQVMEGLKFLAKFIGWVMQCTKTVSYTILVNGEPTEPFEAARGLRQGDPISPFLFAIAMEYLSRTLHRLREDKQFKSHPRCAKLSITHLSFADDLLLFARGDSISVTRMHNGFLKFSKASGLQANLGKSAVYFEGVQEAERRKILEILGYTEGELPFKYLDIPLSTRKLTMVQWQPLIDKIVARTSSWTAKKLSYAGRVQLVQTVLFGIQAYWAQIFVLPMKVIKLIEAHCRSYIWSGTSSITKKSLVAWDRMCTPRAGGLNLTNLRLWNRAAIAKQFWELSLKQDKLWIKWIHEYYIKNQDMRSVKVPNQAAWMVRKILEAGKDFDMGQTGFKPNKSKIRQIYYQLLGDQGRVNWKGLMFKNEARPKAKFIMWLCLQDKLLIADRLTRWGMSVEKQCCLCKNSEETRNHLFAECRYAKELWSRISTWLQWQGCQVHNWEQLNKWIIKQSRGKSPGAHIVRMTYAEVLYAIWTERNQRIFKKIERGEASVAKSVAVICCSRAKAKQAQMLDQFTF